MNPLKPKNSFSHIVLTNLRLLLSGLFTVVVPVTTSGALTVLVITHPSFINDIFQFPHVLLTLLVLTLVMALAMIPTTFSSILLGYSLGFLGLPTMIVCYTFASILGFQVGRVIDGGRLMDSTHQNKITKGLSLGIKHRPHLFMFLVRISPVLPFGLMNLLLPALKVKQKHFLLSGTAGMIPRTALFVWLGSASGDLQKSLQNQEGPLWAPIATGVLVILSILGLSLIARHYYKLETKKAELL